MAPLPSRVTIEEVATAAGVSVATVSRALRSLPNVAPSTRERVVAIADSLGYRADPAASRLAMGRTRTVAVAVPIVNSWYFSQIVSGAEAFLSEYGYDMIVVCVSGDDARERFLREALSMHRRADGLILADLRISDAEAAALAATDIRVVTIGFESESISSVMLNDVAIGHTATQHLVELGHRRIALIQGIPDDEEKFAVPHARKRGYDRAVHEADADKHAGLVEAGYFSVRGGYDAMSKLLQLERPPTAVFAMSDEMAMGAMRAARDAGLDVPGDLSVVGVDDHELSHVVDLTTVEQDVQHHGATAARWIVDDIANDECVVYRSVPETQLVVRGSTAVAGD